MCLSAQCVCVCVYLAKLDVCWLKFLDTREAPCAHQTSSSYCGDGADGDGVCDGLCNGYGRGDVRV